MSEEEFLNRILNKIAKEFGYDVASILELIIITKDKKVEQLENIRKEAIVYIKDKMELTKECPQDLLNILNKGGISKYE